jgi:hypothetical protein
LRFKATTAIILAAVSFCRVDCVQSVTNAVPKLVCHLEVAAAPYDGGACEHVVDSRKPNSNLHCHTVESSSRVARQWSRPTRTRSGGEQNYLKHFMVPHRKRFLEISHEL